MRMPRSLSIACAAAIALGSAGVAMAQEAPTEAQVRARLTEMGYT